MCKEANGFSVTGALGFEACQRLAKSMGLGQVILHIISAELAKMAEADEIAGDLERQEIVSGLQKLIPAEKIDFDFGCTLSDNLPLESVELLTRIFSIKAGKDSWLDLFLLMGFFFRDYTERRIDELCEYAAEHEDEFD